MGMKGKIAIGFLLLVSLVLLDAFYVVEQREQAIVLEFKKPITFTKDGEEVSYISSPGLKMKLPFVQDVIKFSKQTLTFNATDKEVLDVEQKNLRVNAFAKYNIIDPLAFYETVTDINGINQRLDRIFEAALRNAIGTVPLKNLLTQERAVIMDQLQEEIARESQNFGIKIIDVRIVRTDLPDENSKAIYDRMRSEREKEARAYRAEGQERAKVITSTADKVVRVMLSEANRKALITRGEGDAEAARIYAEAYNKDPKFFEFYRAMQALDTSFKDTETKMVLSPDSDLLKYLKNVE